MKNINIKKIKKLSVFVLLVICCVGCKHKAITDEYYYIIFKENSNLEVVKENIEDDNIGVNDLIYNKFINKNVTPLFLTIVDDVNPHISDYLLEKKANPNLAYDDQTLLMVINNPDYVETNVGVEFEKKLIKYGADVNIKDKKGYTALDYAVENRMDYESIKLLIDNKAVISEKTITLLEKNYSQYVDSNRYTIPQIIINTAKKQGYKFDENNLFQNIVLGNSDKVLELIKKDSNYDKTLNYYIVAFDNAKCLDYLIKQGFKIDSKDESNNTLMWIASTTGNLEVIKDLVSKGFNLDFSKTYLPEDFDPLKQSIISNHINVTKYFLEKGVKFNIDKKLGYDSSLGDGMAPDDSIQGAIYNNNMDMLKLIIKYNYPINKNVLYREIMYSIRINNIEAIKYFLEFKPNLNYIDKRYSYNISIVDEATISGSYDSLKLLVEHGAKLEKNNTDILRDAVNSGDINKVKFLIENGVSVNSREPNEDGSEPEPPIVVANDYGYFDIMKYLVEHGANVNNEEENLVLYQASYSYRILQYLIDQGAGINYIDLEDGSTPLMIAIQNGIDKNVEILLKAKADTSIKDKKGKTALDYAKESGNKKIIKLMEEYTKN